jgi:glycosyltransferase involved in cell wall biosynthesis
MKQVILHASSVHAATDNRIFQKECLALAQNGLTIHLAAISAQDVTTAGVNIHGLPEELNRFRRAALGSYRIWKLLRRIRPDALHIHDPELIPLAVLWKAVTRRPAVYDAHEDLRKQVLAKPYLPKWARRPAAALAGVLELAADRRLSLIVAATPAIARNFHRAPVAQVQNFPWLASFERVTPIEQAAAQNVTYVGGLDRERGAFELFAALETRHDPPWTLTIAGPLSDEVQQRISEGDVSNMSYVGRRPVSEVPEIISSGIAGVVLFQPLPNHLESQPTKLFEYMAAGRPFVASDFPYWRELLGRFDCGTYADPTDPAAIRRAIESLVVDIGRAKQMGLRGRAAVEEWFTFEKEAQKLCTAVRKMFES